MRVTITEAKTEGFTDRYRVQFAWGSSTCTLLTPSLLWSGKDAREQYRSTLDDLIRELEQHGIEVSRS
jgi:hypothetical protein